MIKVNRSINPTENQEIATPRADDLATDSFLFFDLIIKWASISRSSLNNLLTKLNPLPNV